MAFSTELRINRYNTKAFIEANPTLIRLIPRTMRKVGSGSRWVDGTPRPTQRMRLIDIGNVQKVSAPDGVQRMVTYQLLGAHNAVIGRYDYWIDEWDIRWEVSELLVNNNYEMRAEVIRYDQR